MLLNAVRKTLDATGLRLFARSIKKKLQAHGLYAWEPLVPEEDFKAAALGAINTLKARGHEFGDYVEFGVSRGTSLACMHDALVKAGVSAPRLVGFDSFEGLSDLAEGQGWSPGDFASTEAATRRYLADRQVSEDRLRLIKGWFSDTANETTRKDIGLEKISLLMVDCDVYTASVVALNFAAPSIKDECVIIFDDWGWTEKFGHQGQKEAFAEFLKANPRLSAEPLPSYRKEAKIFLVSDTSQTTN